MFTCISCKYCFIVYPDSDFAQSECRRYPPQSTGVERGMLFSFSTVLPEHDWCGEFKEKEKEK